MTDNRSILRQHMRARRHAIHEHARLAAGVTLAEHLLTLPFAPQSGAVAGYWAMNGEIPCITGKPDSLHKYAIAYQYWQVKHCALHRGTPDNP